MPWLNWKKENDSILWVGSRDGCFTTKLAHESILQAQEHPLRLLLKAIYYWHDPEQVRYLFWKIAMGILPTNGLRSVRWHTTNNANCSLRHIDSNLHILRECRYVREVWNPMQGGLCPNQAGMTTFILKGGKSRNACTTWSKFCLKNY